MSAADHLSKGQHPVHVEIVTKRQAHYRESTNPHRCCGNCDMRHGHRCDKVEGDIETGDVCMYWEHE